jgi:hypothetical protein
MGLSQSMSNHPFTARARVVLGGTCTLLKLASQTTFKIKLYKHESTRFGRKLR